MPVLRSLVEVGGGLLAVVLMAPLAMTMGMPMPIGIRLLERNSPELIPWAWGVNGATSVMGSVAALVIAILSGFNQALLVGAGLYYAYRRLAGWSKAIQAAIVSVPIEIAIMVSQVAALLARSWVFDFDSWARRIRSITFER